MKSNLKINKMKSGIFVALLSVLFLACDSKVTSNSTKRQAIDSLINYCFQNELFNGTILILSNGEIIYERALGYTDYKCDSHLQLNSVFSLASVSKTFTAASIMMLKERGQVSYEDNLSKYFPNFPNGDDITIYHLLTHTSGLVNYLEYGGIFRVDGKPEDFQDNVTNQKAFEYLKSVETLRFAPGERREYSNSGYLILSLIVEKVSGKPFHEFMQKEIFNPLKMDNSYVASNPELNIKNRASGFTDYKIHDDDNLLTSGGGGVFSTVYDLLKWDIALKEGTIISHKTVEDAFKIPTLNNGKPYKTANDTTFSYGFGWVFRMNDNDSIAFHDGGLNACTSMFYRDLKEGYTIIILSNKGSNLPIYSIHNELIKIMNGENYIFPKVPINIKAYSLFSDTNTKSASDSIRNYWKNNTKFSFSINQLNSLGYYYIGSGELNKAKAVLKLNIEFYPDDANVYDSYAESLMLSGDFINAIKYYEKSLELNPDNANGKKALEDIRGRLQ